MLLTETRTAEFCSWLGTAKGPIADVLRSRAAFLAERWRRTGASRRQRKYEVARWMENEISDALLLRTHQSTRNLFLRAASVQLLCRAPSVRHIATGELAEHIAATY